MSKKTGEPATTVPASSPAEQAAIAECQGALAPLAAMMTEHPRIGESIRINRCGEQAEITAADIRAARECLTGEPTLTDCRHALRPLAALPSDFRVGPDAVLYELPGEGQEPVRITNGMIRQARELVKGSV